MTAERALRPQSKVAIVMLLCAAVLGCSSSNESKPETPSSGAGYRGFGGAPGTAGSANFAGTTANSGTVQLGGAASLGGTLGHPETNLAGTSSTFGGVTGAGTGGTTSVAATTQTGGNSATGGSSDTRTKTASGGLATTGGVTGGGLGGKTSTENTVGNGGSSQSTNTRTATASGGKSGIGGSSSVSTGGVTPTGGKSSTASGGTTAAGSSAQCPSSTTLKNGDNKSSLQFGGRARNYIVYVPSSVKAGTPAPLIFDFHGHGGNGAQEESSSGWKQKADQLGVVMVYPDGVDSSWNVGNCCGLAMSENVDDVGFTKAMLDAVSKAICIDQKRVYATGMSNGAGFTHRLACEAADVIAAIAAASADLVTDPCTPKRPISELSIRGLSDTTVAYAGGNTGSTGWYSPGAKKTLDLWKAIDQCTGAETTSLQYCEGYTSCAAGTEVGLCSLPNTGHDTYNNAVGFKVPDVAWEMFQRQPMP